MSPEVSEESAFDGKSRTVCFLCRQRKTKCDRSLPRCGFCIKAKAQCRYVPPNKKRGLRAGYVTELESRIKRLEEDLQALKSTISQPIVPHQSTPIDLFSASPGTHLPTPQPNPPSSIPIPQPPLRSHPHHSALPSDRDAAVQDLMSFPHSLFTTLTQAWFKETQPWIPILNHSELQSALDALPHPTTHIPDLVLRALLALEIKYNSTPIILGYKGRARLSSHLRSLVLVEAMSSPTIASLKALFIIAILDYGSDDTVSTFSLMAICRRMGENIGLYQQLLRRIETQSPQQISLPDRDAFAGDETAIAITWAILSLDAVSSLGVSWRDVSAALVDHLTGVAYLSVPDFRDSFRTHIHLAAIGLQPVHEFFVAYSKGEYTVFDGTAAALCDDIYGNLMSYVHGLPTTSYTILADGAVDFDINHIFTLMLSHTSVIMVYQRYVFDGADAEAVAKTRCLAAYSSIIEVIRNISDYDAEMNSPLVGTLLYNVARFKLSYDRTLRLERDPKFDIVMHSLNMCGRRWPNARRLDIVLRAAIWEVDHGEASGLPDDWWDLSKNSLDIDGQVTQWVAGYKGRLFVGALNGPYA